MATDEEVQQKAQEAMDQGANPDDVFKLTRGRAGLTQSEMDAEAGDPGTVVPADEEESGVPKSTGRFRVSDGGEEERTRRFAVENMEDPTKLDGPRPMNTEQASDRASKAAILAPSLGMAPQEAFQQVKYELETKGESELWKEVQLLAAAHKEEGVREYFTQLVYEKAANDELSNEALGELVEQYNAGVLDLGSAPRTAEEVNKFVHDVVAESQVPGALPEEDKVQQTSGHTYKSLIDPDAPYEENVRTVMESAMMEVLGKNSGSTIDDFTSLAGDAAWAILPGVDQFNFHQIADGLAERGWIEPPGVVDTVFAGETIKNIRDMVNEVKESGDLQLVMDLRDDLVDVVKSKVGGGGEGNELLALFDLMAVTADDPEGVDWDRWLTDIATVFDAAGLGVIPRTIRKMAVLPKLSEGSTLKTVTQANPKAGRQLAAEASQDDNAAKMLGSSVEEAQATFLLPKYRGFDLEGAPGNIVKEIEFLQRQADEALELGSRQLPVLDTGERAQAVERVRKRIELANNATVHADKTAIRLADDEMSVEVDAFFGMTDDYGFGSMDFAVEKAEELFDQADIVYFRRNPSTNKLDELTPDEVNVLKSTPAPGEYFFKIRANADIIPEDVLMISDDQVFSGTGISALFKTHTLDYASKFGRNVVRGANRAHDMGAALTRDLTDLAKENWDKLGFLSKRKVAGILEQGAKEEKWYDYNELMVTFPDITEKEIKAYYAARTFWDTVWEVQNTGLYKQLQARNMKHLRAGEWQGVGAPIPNEVLGRTFSNTSNDIFDPSTGRMASMSPEEIQRAAAKGTEFYRLPNPEFVEDVGSSFVKIDRTVDGSVGRLPRNVMKYIPGYYPRMYEDVYYVQQSRKARINGQQTTRTRTVYTASTKGEGARMASRLNAGLEDGEGGYKVKLASELTDDVVANDMERLNVEGRLFFSPRGHRLENVNGTQAAIEDPISTIQRSANAVGRSTGLQPWLRSMKERFYLTYGSKFVGSRDEFNRLTPTEIAERLNRAGDTLSEEGLGQARDMWNYIRVMQGSEEWDAIKMRRGVITLADFISQSSSRLATATAKGLLRAKDFAPMRALRAFSFTMFLALNPVRQLILQSQQAMYLTGLVPKYMLSGKLFKDSVGFRAALAAQAGVRKLSKFKGEEVRDFMKGKKMAAKAMGVSDSELDLMITKFRESGFAEAIDSHVFVAGALKGDMVFSESFTRHVLKSTAETVKSAGRVPKALGFDAGEMNNMVMTYLASIRRWKDNNPKIANKWHTDRYFDEIMGDARDMALAMTKSGQMSYQRGGLSLAFQFFAIQHKAMLGMLTNRAFTPMERLRIAVSQFTLYGAAGMGLQEFLDKAADHFGIVLDDTEQELLWGGLTDYTVNKLVEVATGEDSDLRIGNEFSPAGGVVETPLEMVMRMSMQTDKTTIQMILDAFMGPSAQAVSRVGQQSSRAMQILGLSAEGFSSPDITRENGVRALHTMAEVASGYSNYIRARMWQNMKRNNILMNEVVPELSDEELFARKWFGVRSAGELDFWSDVQTVSQRGTSSKSRLDEAAEEIYEHYKATALRYDTDVSNKFEFNQSFVEDILERERFVWMAFEDNPSDALYVRQKIGELMNRDRNAGRVGLDTIIIKQIAEGTVGRTEDERKRIMTMIQNTEAISEERKQVLLRMMEDMLSDEPVRRLRDKRLELLGEEGDEE